ncbi:MAG: hypothetical protein ACHQ1D_08840, partial [Nitrososphaerales archaeon]
ATPGLRETYPIFLKEENCVFDHAFEARVIDVLLQEHNKESFLIEMKHSPTEFFAQLQTSNAKLFSQMTTLIDRGALLSNDDAKNVIVAFLNSINESDLRSTAVCFDDEHMLLQSKRKDINDLKIPGSKLLEALTRKGIKAEDFLLFLFLDLSKTTGTDVKRPYNDRAGLTIGKGQPLPEIIQAAMRERELLWGNAQSVIWIMFKSLYQEICSTEQFNLKDVFYWMIRNEAQQISTKVVMRAYQGIYQQIEAVVWNKIRNKEVPYSDYHQRLQKEISLSPYKIYEVESHLQASKKVCEDYVKELCGYFSLAEEQLPDTTLKNINKIIAETSQLIDEMRQPHGAELNAQVHQEQQVNVEEIKEVKEEQKIKSLFDQATNFEFNREEYDDRDQLESIFSAKSSPRYQPVALENCLHIRLPKLLIYGDHFSPISSKAGKTKSIQWLKPINTLVVKINPDSSYQFMACTSIGASYFQNQIHHLDSVSSSQYAIVGMDGHILASSKNLTPQQKILLHQSLELQQMSNFTAFLNGRIKNPVIMSELVRKYGWSQADYNNLVNAITCVHVSRQTITLHENPVFERLCGWRNDKPSFRMARIEQNPSNKLKTVTKIMPPRSQKNLSREEFSPISVKSVLPACLFGRATQARFALTERGLLINAIRNSKQYSTQSISGIYQNAPGTIIISDYHGRESCFVIYEVEEITVPKQKGRASYTRKVVKNDKVIYVDNSGKLSLHTFSDTENPSYAWNKPLTENINKYLSQGNLLRLPQKLIKAIRSSTQYSTQPISELQQKAPGTRVIRDYPGRQNCFIISEIEEITVPKQRGHESYTHKVVKDKKVIYIDNSGKLSLHEYSTVEKPGYKWDKPLTEEISNYLSPSPVLRR